MLDQTRSESLKAVITAAIATGHPAESSTPLSAQPVASQAKSSLFNENDQLKLLVDKFAHYASFGCAAPQPDRHGSQFEDLAYAYAGNYENTTLSEEQDHRLRQGFALQQWLCLDAMDHLPCLTDVPGMPGVLDTPWLIEMPEPSSEQLASFRTSTEKKCNALRKLHKIHLLRLRQHGDLTEVLFQWLVLVAPSDMSTTTLPEECIELMRQAHVDLPLEHNPLELYRSLGRRLLEQEKEVVEANMALLRSEMQGARMRLYQAAGQFLKKQATTIMKEYEDLASRPTRSSDADVYQRLEAVLDEPIYTMWPAPEQPEIFGFMGRPGTL